MDECLTLFMYYISIIIISPLASMNIQLVLYLYLLVSFIFGIAVAAPVDLMLSVCKAEFVHDSLLD